jgi:PPOX class probable F420-dependent enzyme
MAHVPEELRDVFDQPALAHVSYLDDRGRIVTWPMWADFDGEHILISSPVGSKKGQAFRKRPQVSVSIVSTDNPWHWLSASGRIVDIKPDENLEFIDRMARKYTGKDYQRRTPREVFTVELDRVSPGEERMRRAREASRKT